MGIRQGGQPASPLCASMCRGGVEERTMLLLVDFWGLAWYSPCFQSLNPLSICDWHRSSCCPGCGSQGGWVCTCTSSVFRCPNPHWIYSQKLWRLIFLALVPCVEGTDVGLGVLTPEISTPIFICHTWQNRLVLFCVSIPPTSLDGCGFFNSIIVRLPFNSSSVCSG